MVQPFPGARQNHPMWSLLPVLPTGSDLWAAGTERPGHLQEEVLHDVVVVGGAAVWEEAGGKDDNGVETFTIVPCGEAAGEQPWTGLGRALSQF